MTLNVYLYGVQIGALLPDGGTDYRLSYDAGQIEGFGSGSPVLSNSLPASEEPYTAEATRDFFEGMLPEGTRRRKIAAELGVDPGDTFALVAELGRDCPGAISVLEEDEHIYIADEHTVTWLGEGELGELLAAPPLRFFDAECEARMRFILPGLRHKLALVSDDGRWAWPEADAPSTHIVKPETGKHPELVANEMFCSTAVAATQLWVAPTAVETIAGRLCLVSRRFDRAGESTEAEHFHQENFCQALGFSSAAPPGSSEAEGPGFSESSGLLRAIDEPDSVTVLLALQICNYLLGNGDAHPKNLALLFTAEGPLQAPFYDIASTAVYDDPLHTGLTLTESYAETATLEDLIRIAALCSLDFEHCRNVAGNITNKLMASLGPVAELARTEGWHAPVIDEIIAFAEKRAVGLARELGW